MLAWMLAFAAGIYTVMQFPVLPSPLILWPWPVLIVCAWRLPWLRLPVCFCTGACWMILYGHMLLADSLPANLEQEDLLVEGRVVSLPESFDRYQRFRFLITHRHTEEGKRIPFRLNTRLNWYASPVAVMPGEYWRFTVRLRRPHGFMNPGGYDYEAWLLRQRIRALGYVREAASAKRLAVKSGAVTERLRFTLKQKIEALVPADYLGLIIALSLGDRSGLTNRQRDLLNRTGTSHLIAISGLHLGLVAGIVFFLARLCWRQFPVLTDKITAPLFAGCAALAAAGFYAMLAGFTLPTQRALIMLAVLCFAIGSSRPIRARYSLTLAGFLVLLYDPMSLLAMDFWLSFSAVALILYLLQGRRNRFSRVRRWFYLQIALCVSLLPLLATCFNQVPVYSLFANLFAIPLIGMLVVPMVLIAVCLVFVNTHAAALLLNQIAGLIDLFWWYLRELGALPGSSVAIPDPGALGLLAGVAGMLVLFMPRGLPGRWLGILGLFPLFFPMVRQPTWQEFDFVMLDVGQGLSALVKTKSHSLLFDTGARFSERFNVGEAVLVPYLRQNGVTKLDTLVISHGDNDHIGGAEAVITSLQPEVILTSVPARLESTNGRLCQQGQKWSWDGVHFEMMHPATGFAGSENNRSCVLKVSSLYGSVLLTGDIEKQAEKQLLQLAPKKLAADILVVPHHGSRSSSTPAFIEAVMPEHAFIAAGYRNRFNLPNQDILTRYNDRAVKTHVSYQTGALQVQVGKAGLNVQSYRAQQQRFWHNTMY